MRIKSVRAVQPGTEISPPDWRTWMGQILVIVETDDGLTGWGVGGGGRAGIHVVDTALHHLLIGADAGDVEGLWEEMYRATLAYGRKGIAIMAVSGVDLALWDLRAKRAQKPLVELLGGKPGEPVRAYKTGFSAEEGIEAGGQGFSAVKIHAGIRPGEEIGGIVAGIEKVRKTLGPHIQLRVTRS